MTPLQRFARRLWMPHLSLHAKLLITAGFALSLYGGASALASFGDDMLAAPLASGNRVSAELEVPALDEQVEQLAAQSAEFIAEEKVRSGDTIATLLQRLNVEDAAALDFVRRDQTARRLFEVRPGRSVVAKTDELGRLVWLQFPVNAKADADDAPAAASHVVRVERDAQGALQAAEQTIVNERRVEMRAGIVTSSLFGATDAAGVPDAVTRQIADIFDSEIDFHVDLRKGDAFRVVYETYYMNGEYVRAGRVLAVQFLNAGTAYEASWFESRPGKGGYYSPDGHNLRRAYLRSPLEFSRVSSGFTDNRLHPIQMRWKKHTGVDYAAPTGTPIRSVADGTVEFAGWKNGYGNVIVVKHSSVYETLYAHMSRFAAGIRRGMRVDQGQVIGHVGMTGWATGPHLHYEFHIGGKPHDPLRVALPEAAPIDAQARAAFLASSADYARQLALLGVAPVALR